MTKLGVNIDHVATLRQARLGIEPEPLQAAVLAELGGADSIVIHLREDRRHIQDRDLRLLREAVTTRLNLEMGISDDIVRIALDVKPHQATFVPEKRQELTTEGGLDVAADKQRIRDVISLMHRQGIEVSLFVDPVRVQLEAARWVQADAVEIHTGGYANAKSSEEKRKELYRITESAMVAKNLHFAVAAGHGLNYKNVAAVTRIPEIVELNIGHSIISRAVFTGIEAAVREMKELLNRRQ